MVILLKTKKVDSGKMKVQILIEYDVVFLLREVVQDKIKILEYQLGRSKDIKNAEFYNSGYISEQLQSLHDVLRQISS